MGANTELTGGEIANTLLEQSKIIVVGGFGLNPQLSGTNIRELFARAKKLDVITVLDVVLDDVELARNMLQEALPVTDFFLPNFDEARMLTGLDDVKDQVAEFLRWGARRVVVTCGAQGAYLANPDEGIVFQPAFDVEQIDGTGGGDAFLSGFLYALLRGKTHRDCLIYGSAMGASCVQHAGATTGVFNSEQLEEFVAEHRNTPPPTS